MSKVIIVEVEKVEKYPPVLSIINYLASSQHQVVLCTTNASSEITDLCSQKGIALYSIRDRGVFNGKWKRLFHKVLGYPKIHFQLWKFIKQEYDKNSFIWVCSVVSLKYLGNKLYGRNYILHLFELAENLSVFTNIKYPKVDLKMFCMKSHNVVECEYNRAHITKVWFSLDKLPIILPNKLLLLEEPNYSGMVPSSIINLLERLKYKKIILYQGIISPERPLSRFIDAVQELADDYVFLIMGHSSDFYPESEHLFFCPYLPAPYHLYVTQKAYIGIMCYVASSSGYSYTSPLNTIYCAPNKLFEYSRYGIPMIGNKIPGLEYTIEANRIGVCTELDKDSIISAIRNVSENYEEYSRNSTVFYQSVDVGEIIESALKEQ